MTGVGLWYLKVPSGGAEEDVVHAELLLPLSSRPFATPGCLGFTMLSELPDIIPVYLSPSWLS